MIIDNSFNPGHVSFLNLPCTIQIVKTINEPGLRSRSRLKKDQEPEPLQK